MGCFGQEQKLVMYKKWKLSQTERTGRARSQQRGSPSVSSCGACAERIKKVAPIPARMQRNVERSEHEVMHEKRANESQAEGRASWCIPLQVGAFGRASDLQLGAAIRSYGSADRAFSRAAYILNEETWGWVGVTQNILRGGEVPYLLIRQGREAAIKVSRRSAGASSVRERYR